MIVIRMMTKSDCDQKNGNMFNWGGCPDRQEESGDFGERLEFLWCCDAGSDKGVHIHTFSSANVQT